MSQPGLTITVGTYTIKYSLAKTQHTLLLSKKTNDGNLNDDKKATTTLILQNINKLTSSNLFEDKFLHPLHITLKKQETYITEPLQDDNKFMLNKQSISCFFKHS